MYPRRRRVSRVVAIAVFCSLAGAALALSIWSFWPEPAAPVTTTLEFELASGKDTITYGKRDYTWPSDAERIYERVLSDIGPLHRDRDGLPRVGAVIRVPENARPVRLWRLLVFCKFCYVSWVRVERGDDKVTLRVLSAAQWAEIVTIEPRMARLGLLTPPERKSAWSLTELQATVLLRGPAQIWFAPSEEWGTGLPRLAAGERGSARAWPTFSSRGWTSCTSNAEISALLMTCCES
jgi:hypothetical protein